MNGGCRKLYYKIYYIGNQILSGTPTILNLNTQKNALKETAQRMYWIEKIIGFSIGAFALCVFSTLQKIAIGAPLVIQGYLVPISFGGISGLFLMLWNDKLRQANRALQQANDNLEIKVRERTHDLEKALSEIKTLRGILPICSHCKRIRDDKGYWNKIEAYIEKHSDASFTHGICQECAKKYYPDMDIYDD